MHLFSEDFKDGDKVPEKHVFNGKGYIGKNISPHLAWKNVPLKTKSFVITCYDPDAPTGSGWWHWVVVNIPSHVKYIMQGAGSGITQLPQEALQTRTDFGKNRYDGPAPPSGETHRYKFTLNALDTNKLNVNKDDSGAVIGYNVHFHLIDSASITLTYP